MVRQEFYDPITGLNGTQYNVTLGYATGDLAALTVVTSGLSGIGLNATVSEVMNVLRERTSRLLTLASYFHRMSSELCPGKARVSGRRPQCHRIRGNA